MELKKNNKDNKDMFVSFLYELDRTTWPKKWQRPFSNYIENLKKLLDIIPYPIIVFSDHPEILKLKNTVFKKKESFEMWKRLDKVKKSITRKNNFNLPEFFSPEYITLQMCKFEALYITKSRFWIDAGLRPTMYPKTWEMNYFTERLHISQFNKVTSEYDIIFGKGNFIAGGLFQSNDWLYSTIVNIINELETINICVNDQQILSIVYLRYPHKFHARKIYNGIFQDWKDVISFHE